jgi:hypothetical protein
LNYFTDATLQFSLKNPAVTTQPGDRDDTGASISITVKPGNFGPAMGHIDVPVLMRPHRLLKARSLLGEVFPNGE